MKLILFFAALSALPFLFSCSHKPLSIGSKWLVTIPTEKKMEKSYKKVCPCNDDSIQYTLSTPELYYIDSTFGNPKKDTVSGYRYRKADERLYRRLWHLSKTDSAGYVRNYDTKLLRFTIDLNKLNLKNLEKKFYEKTSNNSVIVYSYIFKLCPPPPLCRNSGNPSQ